MSVSDLQTWFLHPETDKKIHVIFDVCHMVKLLRNLLVDKKVICHEQNGKLEEIRWWYIESLNRLQDDLGFSFANKLKNQHIEWTRHKMNIEIPEHVAKNICQKVQWNDSTQKHAIYKASVDKINPV